MKYFNWDSGAYEEITPDLIVYDTDIDEAQIEEMLNSLPNVSMEDLLRAVTIKEVPSKGIKPNSSYNSSRYLARKDAMEWIYENYIK